MATNNVRNMTALLVDIDLRQNNILQHNKTDSNYDKII